MSILGLPEMIADVAEDTGCTQYSARKIIESFLRHIEECMTFDDVVRIKEFGRFYVANMPARTARNVKDGEPVNIPPMKRMRFTPSRVLVSKIQDRPGDRLDMHKTDTSSTKS